MSTRAIGACAGNSRHVQVSDHSAEKCLTEIGLPPARDSLSAVFRCRARSIHTGQPLMNIDVGVNAGFRVSTQYISDRYWQYYSVGGHRSNRNKLVLRPSALSVR